MRNTVENIIIALVVFIFGTLVGGYVGYQSALNSAEKILELQKTTIELAIKKETTNISNAVTTEIRKIKGKKSEPINIVIDPTTKSIISQSDTSQIITVEQKRGFFKRLFQKKH